MPKLLLAVLLLAYLYAGAQTDKTNELLARRPYYSIYQKELVADLQAKGWQIEQHINGKEIFRRYNNDETDPSRDISLQPGRVYGILVLTCDARHSVDYYLYLNKEKQISLSNELKVSSLFYPIHKDTLTYNLSHLFFVDKPVSINAYTRFLCYSCPDSDSSQFLEGCKDLYIISKPLGNSMVFIPEYLADHELSLFKASLNRDSDGTLSLSCNKSDSRVVRSGNNSRYQEFSENIPAFQKARMEFVEMMKKDGWRVEKYFDRKSLFYSYRQNDLDTNWNITLQPSRFYMTVSLMMDQRLNPNMYIAYKNEIDRELGDRYYNSGKKRWKDSPLFYNFSHAAFVRNKIRLTLQTELKCYSCGDMDPSAEMENTAAVYILSAPKTGNQPLLNNQVAYGEVNGIEFDFSYLVEAADPTEGKNPDRKDNELRKTVIDAILKKMRAKGVSLQQKLSYVMVGDGKSYKLNLNYQPNQKRTIFVMNEGNDEFVEFTIRPEGYDDQLTVQPDNTSNFDNYSISKIALTGPIYNIVIAPFKNKAATFSILVFTQTDEEGYAEAKKVLEDYKKAKEERKKTGETGVSGKDESRIQYTRESFDADEKARKIRAYAEQFEQEAQYLLDELRKAERENWDRSRYIRQRNSLKSAFDKVVKALDDNRATVSTSNPDYPRIRNRYEQHKSQFDNIVRSFKAIDATLEKDKQPSYYVMTTEFSSIIGFARKMAEAE